MDHKADIQIPPNLAHQIKDLPIAEALRQLVRLFPGQVIFSTSFSIEDQVILDIIARENLSVTVFTLDTGRIFPETYSVWSGSRERYPNVTIRSYDPDPVLLQPFLNENGPNSFYESVANRKQCCFIRKVEPLKRALAGQAVWVTGLRAEHSANRGQLDTVEWDEGNGLTKYNPLLHWTTAQVRAYVDEHDVPYNILHDRGFVSIGCQPCTRAIRPGEDFRAGRWWWEDATKKECGLHEHSNSTN